MASRKRILELVLENAGAENENKEFRLADAVIELLEEETISTEDLRSLRWNDLNQGWGLVSTRATLNAQIHYLDQSKRHFWEEVTLVGLLKYKEYRKKLK